MVVLLHLINVKTFSKQLPEIDLHSIISHYIFLLCDMVFIKTRFSSPKSITQSLKITAAENLGQFVLENFSIKIIMANISR